MDFADKSSKYGGWNRATQNIPEMAAFVNKNRLIRASVEVEKISHWINRPFAEVDGHDFMSFEWKVAATLPFLGKDSPAAVRTSPSVIGLSILSASKKITVFIDGQVQIRPLSGHEKLAKLEEHKAGG
jgi:hypothetical protein